MIPEGSTDKHVEWAGKGYAACLMFFTFFFNFAVLNVLTGIFVQKSIDVALPDRESTVLRHRLAVKKEAEELRSMIKEMDTENTGRISSKQFMQHMQNRNMVALFSSAGIRVNDAKLFFEMLSSVNGGDSIDINTFVDGCMAVKGTATSLDMQRQLFEQRNMFARLQQFERDCLAAVEQLTGNLRTVEANARDAWLQAKIERESAKVVWDQILDAQIKHEPKHATPLKCQDQFLQLGLQPTAWKESDLERAKSASEQVLNAQIKNEPKNALPLKSEDQFSQLGLEPTASEESELGCAELILRQKLMEVQLKKDPKAATPLKAVQDQASQVDLELVISDRFLQLSSESLQTHS